MKNLTYIIIILFSLNTFSQTKYITKTGMVGFEASVPSFEEVKASNNSVTAIINKESGEFASLVLINGFRFKNALMEEHFNENYAESDKFPKATFKGKIINFDFDKLTKNSKVFKINGSLTFHGKTKPLENIPINASIDGDYIIISGTFDANAEDYGIEIPKIVRTKISKKIEVTFNFKLKKK